MQTEHQYVWSLRYVDSPILRDSYSGGVLQSGSRIYYLTDANHNVTAVTNLAGAVQERYDYDAFGKVTIYDANWANPTTTSAVGNTLLFAGQDVDATTGLQYARARWYSSSVGGFISRDPIGFAAGDPNTYRFVGNAPADATDSTGLIAIVAARDLNGFNPLGTHQFVVLIPDNPNDFSDKNLSDYGIRGLTSLQDLGNGQKGIVLGAHNIDGRLSLKAFEDADLQAFREQNDPAKYPPGTFSDFDTETEVINPPICRTDTQFIEDILKRASNYQKNEGRHPISYPFLGGFLNPGNAPNSNAWAQNLISGAGGLSKGDFSGMDIHHGDSIDKQYFGDPSEFKVPREPYSPPPERGYGKGGMYLNPGP